MKQSIIIDTKRKSEKWVPIIGFEGSYQISNWGRLKSLPRWHNNRGAGYLTKEIIVRPKTGHKKYQQYELRANGVTKTFKKSRLVAIHFLSNPMNKKQVNHKDGNKQNDYFENLEWVTQAENIQHSYDFLGRKAAYKGKFGKDHNQSKAVTVKFQGCTMHFDSLTECAKQLGVTIQSVSQAIKKKRKCKNYNIYRYQPK